MFFDEIIERKLDDFVLITKEFYPSMVFYIRNRKIIMRKEMIGDIASQTKEILKQLKIDISNKDKYIYSYPDSISEVLINESGVWKYVIKEKK